MTEFKYTPTEDFNKPFTEQLGMYPRVHDFTFNLLRWLGAWLCFLFIRLQYLISIEGKIPDDRKLVIVANHQSHLDTWALIAALPYKVRSKLTVLAAADYFYTQNDRALLATVFCQAVAFDRLNPMELRNWQKIFKEVKQGYFLFYPSGSRSSDDFQTGLLKILLKNDWSVLGVKINGTKEAWPIENKYWKPFKKLKFKFYEPYTGNNIEDLLSKLKKELL
ncbi:MAG: lysophospholipid acyltransferase family protein [bacterium]